MQWRSGFENFDCCREKRLAALVRVVVVTVESYECSNGEILEVRGEAD